jgi:hypothetical protein
MTRPILAPAAGATILHCRRLFITEPGTVELLDDELPPLGERDVYATTVLSGISHGTELAWLRGTAAALHRTWDPQRRLYLDGPGRAYPVAPGYESIARVAAVGPTVSAVRVGDLITVDGPHANGHVLSERAAAAGRLPDGVTPEQAVFFILARVALGGVHDANLLLGETVVVMGLGTVGLLAAQQARLGATVNTATSPPPNGTSSSPTSSYGRSPSAPAAATTEPRVRTKTRVSDAHCFGLTPPNCHGWRRSTPTSSTVCGRPKNKAGSARSLRSKPRWPPRRRNWRRCARPPLARPSSTSAYPTSGSTLGGSPRMDDRGEYLSRVL